jgi:hypothetical protein
VKNGGFSINNTDCFLDFFRVGMSYALNTKYFFKNFFIIAKKGILCQFKMYYAMFIIMDGISKEIENLEEKIRVSEEELRSAAYELGLAALRDRETLAVEIGNSLLETLDKLATKKGQLEARLSENRQIERQIEENKSTAASLRREIESLSVEKDGLLSRLGAIALVQCQSGIAPQEISDLLKDSLDEERNAQSMSCSDRFFTRAMGKIKLSSLKRNESGRMLRVGRTLYEKGVLARLSGDQVPTLLEELQNFDSRLEKAGGRLRKSEDRLSRTKGEMLNTINYSEPLEEASCEFTEAAIAYGFYLFENGNKWIGEHTPEAELDILSRMLELRRTEDEARTEIEERKKEISIDELSLLIANDKKTIALLKTEKDKIDSQIERLESHISAIEDKIRAVRKS